MSADRPADAALDDLLERIAAEAARRARPSAGPSRPAWSELSARASMEDAPGAPAFRVREDRRYDIADFLRLEGDEFLDACYRAILGRTPDAVGREAFRARLAAGDRPVEVVGRLALSAEGRAHRARIAGLWPRFVPALAFRVPLAGWLLEWAAALVMLPRAGREQRARAWAGAIAQQEIRHQSAAARRRFQAEIERLSARRPGSGPSR